MGTVPVHGTVPFGIWRSEVKGKDRAAVKTVFPGSIAEELEIEPGDILLTINGEKITDIFDYRYLIANEQLTVELLKKNGEVWELEIEKEEYEDLGVEFENPLINEEKSCCNKCIFCFIDQLPKGMRDTLYFKDDDSRLSFLTGNYVTLTNVSYEDIRRVARYKMSPINVSVHTTNPKLREFMLNNRFAGDVLEKINILVKGGVKVNCQVVLCRGINDGHELDRTISDLAALYPGVSSLSVVPVGITKHREGLFRLIPYDAGSSKDVIEQVESRQAEFLSTLGSRFVYLADEFYIIAGKGIPDYEYYEDFPQIENGVGLLADLRKGFFDYLEKSDDSLPHKGIRRVSIATGVSAANFIRELVEILEKRYNNLKVNVYEIVNHFFGENVTVTGLITGTDLISQLEGKDLGDELLISSSMLKSGEDVFLDDVTTDTLREKLCVDVVKVENKGRDFIKKVAGLC